MTSLYYEQRHEKIVGDQNDAEQDGEDDAYPTPLQHAPLCSRCSQIFQNSILNNMPVPRTTFLSRAQRGEMYQYLANPDDIVSAAEEGSHICCSLAEIRIPKEPIWYFIGLGDEDDEYILCLELQHMVERFNKAKTKDDIALAKSSSFARFYLYPRKQWSKTQELSMVASSQSWTGHQHVLKLARYWLDDCTRNHASCRRTITPKEYPTRLLDVSGKTVRLVQTAMHSPNGPYATLSHCWGSQPFFVLNPGTHDALKAGVRLDQFPMSFQDAIIVTRNLQIDWLWIDCYCIIQGASVESKQDWETESKKMGSVYANGLINIGSDHAENPSIGMFVNRDSHLHQPLVVSWKPVHDRPELQYDIVQYTHRDLRKRLLDTKMFTRAWCVQERVLSSRMLHFGSSQLHWECDESPWVCERFPETLATLWDLIRYLQENPFGLQRLLASLRHEIGEKYYERAIVPAMWGLVLRLYTKGNLTYPQVDRLRAIAGIADQAQTMLSEGYRWGFLQSSLPALLYWINRTLDSEEFQQAEFGTEFQKPLQKRVLPAPSWSWASVDDEVEFVATGMLQAVHYLVICLHDCCDFVARSIDIRNEFGLVCLGRLLPVKSVVLCPERPWDDYMLVHAVHPQYLKCKISSERSFVRPENAFMYSILPLFTFQQTFCGLILQRLRNGTYQRVGTSFCEEPPIIQEHLWYAAFKKTSPQLLLLV